LIDIGCLCPCGEENKRRLSQAAQLPGKTEKNPAARLSQVRTASLKDKNRVTKKKGHHQKEGPVTHRKEAHLIGTRCDPSAQCC